MEKEFVVCVNCAHCREANAPARSDFLSFDKLYNYVCAAHPKENPVHPVTGTPYAEPNTYCYLINTTGNCKKFEPGEKECTSE